MGRSDGINAIARFESVGLLPGITTLRSCGSWPWPNQPGGTNHMKSFLTLSVAAATMTLGLMAQKLETQKPDPKTVLRVETAKDHLTVIELSDAVTMVALGNRSAFTVERRENKVFVTPTDEGARTNLFIWTSGGRYAYELVPAVDVEQMHFAIDQVSTTVTSSIPVPATGEVAQTTARLPTEMLTAAMPVLVIGERETNGRVEV